MFPEMRSCFPLKWMLLFLLLVGKEVSLIVTQNVDDIDGNDINLSSCKEGFLYILETDSCYLVSDAKASWIEAKAECDALGATLAIFESEEELSIISDIVNNPVWIGLQDEMKASGLILLDGSNSNEESLGGEELENSEGGDCMGLKTPLNGEPLENVSCGTNLNFVCEQTPSQSEENTECPRGYRYFPEMKACYILNHRKATWFEAQKKCVRSGGILLTIHSQKEQDFIATLTDERTWIGLSDIQYEGHFVWEDGTPLIYSNFMTGQPTNWKDEDCTEIRPDAMFKWNDDSCEKFKKFFCEYKPENGVLNDSPLQDCPCYEAKLREQIKMLDSTLNLGEKDIEFLLRMINTLSSSPDEIGTLLTNRPLN